MGKRGLLRPQVKHSLEAALTWLDLTARDREQMRRVLDLLKEQGTVDEMGLGTIRDAFANSLFPGTSSIQTRLRYVVFIPWTYQRLEAKKAETGDITRAARDAEIELVAPLKESDDSGGVIGARSGHRLSRLASHVYWAGLVRWKIFKPRQSQSWYHTHFSNLARSRHEVARADDPGVIWTANPIWHPRLPKPPNEFPGKATFALTSEESDFIRGRLEETCRGSLLAWLAREGSADLAESFWDDHSAIKAPPDICNTIEFARRFSLHVEGLPLLYNLLLAEQRHVDQGSDQEHIDQYRTELAEWANRESAEGYFDSQELWKFMAPKGFRPIEPQRRFVEGWSTRVREIGAKAVADDSALHDLVRRREHQLKGHRGRFMNKGRLLDWSPGVGVGRMDFRWFRVRQLLIDLHRGFQR